MTATHQSRYLPHLVAFADFDNRAINEGFIHPHDRTALDSAILGLVGPRSTFNHATNYLNNLNL